MKKFWFSLLMVVFLPCIVFCSACKDKDYELTIESIYALVQDKGYSGTLEDFIQSIKGETGVGIASISLVSSSSSGSTYCITLTDGSTTNINISNGLDGVGICSILKSSTNGLQDTYTILFSDNTSSTFTVTNGKDGLSAYEIYLQYNPDYTKTEQEWLLDLVNGNLSQTETFTVTFNSNGGTEVASQTVEFAHKATKPADPTKTGYTFNGWFYLEEQWSFIGYSVTENITLSAKWTPEEYEISYNLNGGEITNNITSYTIESEDITLPEPTKYGYTFAGWYTNEDFSGNAISCIPQGSTGNISLYAKYVASSQLVTLNANGGECSEVSVNLTYGEACTLPTPTKEYYTFGGWEYNENVYTTGTVWQEANANSLTAIWNCIFTYTSDSTGITITGFSDYAPTDLTYITLPTSLDNVEIKAIAANAFTNYELTYVILPVIEYEICENAFSETTIICFLGSVDDWDSLGISCNTENICFYSDTGEALDDENLYWHYNEEGMPAQI